jgi:hypothetical protein
MADKLTMRWSKRERDFVINYPSGPDGHLVHRYLCCDWDRTSPYWSDGGMVPARVDPAFVKELEARGYDLTTLKFSVQRKTKGEP